MVLYRSITVWFFYLCKSIWCSILGNILQNIVSSPENLLEKLFPIATAPSDMKDRIKDYRQVEEKWRIFIWWHREQTIPLLIWYFLDLWKQRRNNISQLYFFIKSIHNSLGRKHHHIPSHCPCCDCQWWQLSVKTAVSFNKIFKLLPLMLAFFVSGSRELPNKTKCWRKWQPFGTLKLNLLKQWFICHNASEVINPTGGSQARVTRENAFTKHLCASDAYFPIP